MLYVCKVQAYLAANQSTSLCGLPCQGAFRDEAVTQWVLKGLGPGPREVLQLLPQRDLQQYIDFEKQGQCDTQVPRFRLGLVAEVRRSPAIYRRDRTWEVLRLHQAPGICNSRD